VATPIDSFSFQSVSFPKHKLTFDLPSTFTGGEPKLQLKEPTRFVLHYSHKVADKNCPLELKLLVVIDSQENIKDLSEYIRVHNIHLKMQQRWSDQQVSQKVRTSFLTSKGINWTVLSYRDSFANANVVRAFARRQDLGDYVVVAFHSHGGEDDNRGQTLLDHILNSVTFGDVKTVDADYSTYVNLKFGYSLKYHKSFDFREAFPAVMFHHKDTKDLPYGTNFTVIVEKQDVSLEEFLDVVQKSFEEQMSQYTLVEDTRTTYLGLPAQRRVHQALLPGTPPLSIKSMQVIAKSPDTAYAVSFGSVKELYDEFFKKYGKNMFDTLTFVELSKTQ
jgi:hypothetical protein